jgi:hypothetical protein
VLKLILATAFVFRERRISDPMLDPSLFSRSRFPLGNHHWDLVPLTQFVLSKG